MQGAGMPQQKNYPPLISCTELVPFTSSARASSVAARIRGKRSRLCVILALFFVEFALLFCCGILILLILGYEVVHVRLGLSKLHLIHSLASIPMQERLAPEHGCEVLRDPLEHLLDSCRVARESNSHLQALW